jgi:hypothetical protein
VERPSAARMYDYYLGGSHNFPSDRQVAEDAIRVWPDARHLARASRDFLRRAVTFLADAGIDQFLDLGSGIPTRNNVHEVVFWRNPSARTVYVDSDPVAIAHSNALLADVPSAVAVRADLRDPALVLEHPMVRGFLDFQRPVAVLMVAVLPFVSYSDGPDRIIAAYRRATVAGSYMALTHGTGDYRPAQTAKVVDLYTKARQPITWRSRQEVAGLLAGYELVSPGLVDMIAWRPDDSAGELDLAAGDAARYSTYAAIGRRV